jgi:hypothetical protein
LPRFDFRCLQESRERFVSAFILAEVNVGIFMPILETHLPDSKRFRKETAAERKAVFRSTAFPADKILVRGSNLDKLVDEILGIIKN